MPPCSFVSNVYCAWPAPIRSRSFVSRPWRYSCAPPPASSSWPMWETSKTPALVRTARCSSVIELYCTGISHPAKGTRRAPRAAWRSYRGVRRSVCTGPDPIRNRNAQQPVLPSNYGQGGRKDRGDRIAFPRRQRAHRRDRRALRRRPRQLLLRMRRLLLLRARRGSARRLRGGPRREHALHRAVRPRERALRAHPRSARAVCDRREGPPSRGRHRGAARPARRHDGLAREGPEAGREVAEDGSLGHLLDPVAEVTLLENLTEADGNGFEIAPGKTAVRRKALEDDAARLQAVEELLVLADGDEPPDVRERVLF